MTAAIESHHGLIDDWASELRKQGDAYQETWYRSMCAARGPGWSDAMRASVEMTDPRYPALTRAFHARIESLAEGFHG